jgi:hypothetical protein
MKTIDIGNDFSDTPWGRYDEDGPFNGSAFRDNVLIPELKANDAVEVRIDTVEGFGSSFLEEAFGGIIREGHFTKDELLKKLRIRCDDEEFSSYVLLIHKYINEARKK